MGLTRVRAEQISDIDYKQAVRVTTTSNITSILTSAPSIVDGVALSANDRILVNGQSTGSENGLYYVVTVGTGSNGVWARTQDGNLTGEINAGMIVMVTEGNEYADTLWKLITDNPIVIGTSNLVFTLNSTASFDVINANGTPVSANTTSSTINYTPGNNMVITGSDITDTVTFAVNDTPNFTGNISTSGNLFVSRDVSITGNLTIGANLNVVNVNEYVGATGNISFLGNLLPGTSNTQTYSLGLPGQPWSNIFVANLNVANYTGANLSITGTQTSNTLIVNNDATINGNLTVLGTTTTINSNVIVTNDKNIELANNIANLVNLDGAGIQAGNALNTYVTNWTYNYAANAWSTNVGVSAVGNVQGSYVLGNGAFLTGLSATYSNANVANYLPTYSGNITSGNISVSGNTQSGNLFTAGVVSATGNVRGGNINTVGEVTATGNVYGNVFIGNGSQLTGLVSVSGTAATVTTNAQPNITSLGNLTSLQFNSNVTPIAANVGQLFWDTDNHTVTLGMENSVQQQIGLENYIYVKASSAITNGQAVMFTGANGTNILAAPADTTSVGFKSEYIIGVATQDIALNAFGYITVFGLVHGLNTNAWNVGDILWVDNTTPGALTNTQPTDPNYQIQMAAVTKKAGGDGHIQVRVTPFYQLDRLRNVQTANLVNGQALVYDSANLLWVNGTIANATFANTAGTVTTNAQPNITSVGTLSTLTVTGNITGNYFIGNGSQLTGLSATYSNANVANYLPTYSGDFTANVISSTGNVTAGGWLIAGNSISAPGTLSIAGGNLFVNGLGNVQAGNLLTAGQVSATGNITGSYILGNGSQLTGLPATYANANVAAYLPTYTGNLAGNNLSITTEANVGTLYASNGVSVTGTMVATSANAQFVNQTNGAGWFSAAGNIYGNNSVSVVGNIAGNLFIGNGSQLTGIAATLAGNLSGNLLANGFFINNLTALSVSGQISGNSIAPGIFGNAIAVGDGAGYNGTKQNQGAIAVGFVAGVGGQGNGAIAVGYYAGGNDLATTAQGNFAIAMGAYSALDQQGNNAIAIGYQAGSSAQGVNSIAIGTCAAPNAQPANTIVINATGQPWLTDPASTDAFYVSPIRSSNAFGVLSYSPTTKEVTYSDVVSVTGNITSVSGKFVGNGYFITNLNGTNFTTLAFGNGAGTGSQGNNAIAMGVTAGRYDQGSNAIAIGSSAAFSAQGFNSVAIGNIAGQWSLSGNSIAIGYRAAIGNASANAAQNTANNIIMLNATGANTYAPTANAFYVTPVRNDTVTAIGNVAVYNATSKEIAYSNVINLGGNITGGNILTAGLISATGNVSVGNLNVSGNIVDSGALSIITSSNGNITLSANGTGIVAIAGITSATGNILTAGNITGNVFIGNGSQLTGIISNSIFYGSNIGIGSLAGQVSQGSNTTAIGYFAGQSSQGLQAVAVGYNAGQSSQGVSSVAVGAFAGASAQGAQSVAIGLSAGKVLQGPTAVAIGYQAGQSVQGGNSVSIGYLAGYQYQGEGAVAVGAYSGGVGLVNPNIGLYAVAIGFQAASASQANSAIAIGLQAGFSAQGVNSIAIGRFAAQSNQPANSIVLNATGSGLTPAVASSFYVAPVRNDTVTAIGNVAVYNASTKELAYSNTISLGGSITSANLSVTGTVNISNVTVNSYTFVPQTWFKGTRATSQNVTTLTDTTIIWNSNNDPLNWGNTTTGRITPTKAGWYEVTSRVLFSAVAGNSSAQINHQILVNGTQAGFSQAPNSTNTGAGITMIATAMVSLNGTSDYITTTAYSTLAANVQQIVGNTSSMVLVKWVSST